MPKRWLTRLLAAALSALAALAAAPAPAPAARTLAPLGLSCRPHAGVRFCPGNSLAQRVRSFDGVPLDVDVMLPASGDGPFPTVAMLHAFGSTKVDWRAADDEGRDAHGRTTLRHHYNPVFYARRGYAVLTYTARGFGGSCGAPESRTAGCEAGWLRLADQRHEVRDTQHLLGLLVDGGIARPGALAVTGASYGGAQAATLALLRDRVRTTDGALVPWRSPRGTPLSIAAAWSRHGFTDLTAGLLPNGRYLDFRVRGARESRTPLGMPVEPNVAALLAAARAAYAAPRGADPSADVERWFERMLAGDPFGADVRRVAAELTAWHGPAALDGPPAPLLLESGFSDRALPIDQSLRLFNRLRARDPRAPVWLQLGDVGHPLGDPGTWSSRELADRGAAFLDAIVRRSRRAPARVAAHVLRCPARDARQPVVLAPTWEALHPGAVLLTARRRAVVRSPARRRGAPPPAPPRGARGASPCDAVPPFDPAGPFWVWRGGGYTLLGRPTVRLRLRGATRGGRLQLSLHDISRGGRRVRQLTQGVLRLDGGRQREALVQLDGAAYRVPRGHALALVVTGHTPGVVAPSHRALRLAVEGVELELPVRERPNGRSIRAPRLARAR